MGRNVGVFAISRFIKQETVMQENEQITAIIGKKLGGQASAEALEQLELWLNAGAGNPGEYDQLRKIWTESARVLTLPAFIVDAAGQNVDGNLGIRSIPLYTRRLVAAS